MTGWNPSCRTSTDSPCAPKASTGPLQPNVTRSGREWDQTRSPTESVWYSDSSLLALRAGIGVVNGTMCIWVRVPGLQSLYGVEIYGV